MGLELEAMPFPLDVGNMLELALALDLITNLGSLASLALATSPRVKLSPLNTKSSYVCTWSWESSSSILPINHSLLSLISFKMIRSMVSRSSYLLFNAQLYLMYTKSFKRLYSNIFLLLVWIHKIYKHINFFKVFSFI